MEFSKEEIEFVEFCANYIDCSKAECPSHESCEKGKEICLTIPQRMKEGEELSSDDKEIIQYFMSEEPWYSGCKVGRKGPECPNAQICNDRGEDICLKLGWSLGLSLSEEKEILEKEIQKIILNNIRKIDWGLEEEVEYYSHEYKTPIGRPDIMLKGKKNKVLFVVELKSATASREDVGQLMSYVGWFKENLPIGFEAVKGILLAGEFSPGAKYAINTNSDLEARIFELNVSVKKV
jgi:hypothetical protein